MSFFSKRKLLLCVISVKINEGKFVPKVHLTINRNSKGLIKVLVKLNPIFTLRCSSLPRSQKRVHPPLVGKFISIKSNSKGLIKVRVKLNPIFTLRSTLPRSQLVLPLVPKPLVLPPLVLPLPRLLLPPLVLRRLPP